MSAVEPVPDPAAELARLIEQQRRDDPPDGKRDRLGGRRREVREADLAAHAPEGFSLDCLADPATLRRGGRRERPEKKDGFVYLVGRLPWEGAVQAYVDRKECTCPVCGGRPRFGELCLYCNACDLDPAIAAGRVRLEGLDVDAVPNHSYIETYSLTATRHRAGPLKGGVGRSSNRK